MAKRWFIAMRKKNVYTASESQLETDDEWLHETLRFIKEQRNALRLERLDLEKRKEHLDNINIPDLIAQREALMKQLEGEQHVSPPVEEDHSTSASSMSDTEFPEDSNIAHNEDLSLNHDVAGPSSSGSNTKLESSGQEGDDKSPNSNDLMSATTKPN